MSEPKSNLNENNVNDQTDQTDQFQSTIVSKLAAPPGWKACYLASVDKTTDEAQIVVRPIILWVTVETTEPSTDSAIQEIYQEIRHFIVDADGSICDYEEFEFPFLCVVEPGEDVDEAAAKAIASQLSDNDDRGVC